MKVATSMIVQAGKPVCQDRAEVIAGSEHTVLALADGAGRISGAAEAAQAFVCMVRESADALRTSEDCVRLLRDIDQDLARRNECGETTGVLVVVDPSRIFGASVGDSAARLFTSDGHGELTRGQHRKPLLGSSQIAPPRGFSWETEDGTVVVASHGLWQRASIEMIQSRLRSRGDTDLALRLAELVRLSSGSFPDDVAVITCRIQAGSPVGRELAPD